MAKLLVMLMAALAVLIWIWTGNGSSEHSIAGTSETHWVSAYNDSLFIVEGNKGRGSGFLCKIQGRTVAITNAHVVADNSRFQLINLAGTGIGVKMSAVAVGHDIVQMTPSDPVFDGKGFAMMENVDKKANIGDTVLILGNAEGAKVVTTIRGKIVGMGPNLVEVDAPFVPGNSGSPIVHEKSGTVIGVATYLLVPNVDPKSKEGVTVKTRRFGYRLDSVKAWEPIDWRLFTSQAEQVERIETLSNDFITLFKNCRGGKVGNEGDYQTVSMQRVIQVVTKPTIATRLDGGGKKAAISRFLGELQFITRADVNAFDTAHSYDYFRHRLEDHVRLREAIYKGVNQAIDANR